MTVPDLTDARALLTRACRHYDEFEGLVSPRNGQGVWQIRMDQRGGNGEWSYRLEVDRNRLIGAKPIIADVANNVISALDHVAAAIAKANGYERLKSLYFPLGLTDRDFESNLAKVEPKIGTEMCRRFADARREHLHEVSHICAAKQISNSGKHWELMPVLSSAQAIVVHEDGASQRIFQVPADAFSVSDSFEFFRGPQPLPRVPMSLPLGFSIEGLDNRLPKSPSSIFTCSFRFVEGVFSAVGGIDNAPSTAESSGTEQGC